MLIFLHESPTKYPAQHSAEHTVVIIICILVCRKTACDLPCIFKKWLILSESCLMSVSIFRRPPWLPGELNKIQLSWHRRKDDFPGIAGKTSQEITRIPGKGSLKNASPRICRRHLTQAITPGNYGYMGTS